MGCCKTSKQFAAAHVFYQFCFLIQESGHLSYGSRSASACLAVTLP